MATKQQTLSCGLDYKLDAFLSWKKMADPENPEWFYASLKLCIRKDLNELVIGKATNIQELWTMARAAGFHDGDATGLMVLRPVRGFERKQPWPATVGQSLSPSVIHELNMEIAQGFTYFCLVNDCGREINFEPQLWGDFVRPVRASFEGGWSVPVANTAEIWEFLDSKGISDDAHLTCTIIASDENGSSRMPVRKGQPLQATIMLLTNTAAPEGISVETIRLDFENKKFKTKSSSDNDAAMGKALAFAALLNSIGNV